MAVFLINATVTNACGTGSTAGPTSIPVGAMTRTGLCALPTLTTGLSNTSAQVSLPYNSTFTLQNTTAVTLTGLPAGVVLADFNPSTGVGTLSGYPSSAGSYAISASCINACGGGDTTSSTPSIQLGTLLVGASAPGGLRPSGSGAYFGAYNAVSETGLFIGVRFNTNGTAAPLWAGQASSFPGWFTPTLAGIGSSFWIRATRIVHTFGIGPDQGNLGVWEPLSVDRAYGIGYETLQSTVRSTEYTFEFATDSFGSNIVAVQSGCLFTLIHESTNG